MKGLRDYQHDFFTYVVKYKIMGGFLAYCVVFTSLAIGNQVVSFIFQENTSTLKLLLISLLGIPIVKIQSKQRLKGRS